MWSNGEGKLTWARHCLCPLIVAHVRLSLPVSAHRCPCPGVIACIRVSLPTSVHIHGWSFSFASGPLCSWAVVFVHSRLSSFMRGHHCLWVFSFVGGCLHSWAVGFVCGRLSSLYGVDGVQPHSMDSIWTIFWLATQPFFSFHTHYGVHMEWPIPCMSPCGFHGISTVNSSTIPYGFHGTVHMDSMEESTSNFMENPPIVLSKIVPTLRIKQATPRHITCMGKPVFLPLNHTTIKR